MDSAKSFEQRLARLMQAAGITKDAELASILGINQSSIAAARKRQQLPPGWVEFIAEKFNANASWLFFGESAGGLNQNASEAHSELVEGRTCGCDVDLIMIPRVTARLSAGTGSLETEDSVQGMYAFRADWILRKGNTNNMVLMEVTGDSMAPEIKNGDIVLIDQGKKSIFGYGYYAVGFGEEVYVKQIHTTPKDIILHSLNPQYEDITVSKIDESTDELRIIGRVVWIGREVA